MPHKLIPVYHSPPQSTLSDDESKIGDSDSEPDSEYGRECFAFPELDDKIRQAISDYGAVFPKLNFSSPRVSSPLTFTHKCVLNDAGCRLGPSRVLPVAMYEPSGSLPTPEIV